MEFLDTQFIISDETNRMAGWKILHLVVLDTQSHFVIHKFQNTTIHYIPVGHILCTLPTSSFKLVRHHGFAGSENTQESSQKDNSSFDTQGQE